MIAFLDGRLAGKTASQALIDVQGVGFAVSMSTSALSKLPEEGAAVRVLTYLQVSENGMALYGFSSADEKSAFEQLIGVSGVGPKVALAALSTFSPAQLAEAIAAQDVGLVQKIPGVGKKGASRIILELKGSFDVGFESLGGSGAQAAAGPMRDATEALLSMGFSSAEAELALKGAPDGSGEEALLKYALKKLGSL